MKKTLLILTLVLALLALTACQATVVLDDIAQQLHDANTAPASDTTAAETGGAHTADETAALMIKSLVEATGVKSGDKAFLAINGSGATTLMEMLIVYRAAKKELEALGVSVLPGKCTELLTVQEMAGFQMILCKCCDTCAKYLAAPSDTPYWTTR